MKALLFSNFPHEVYSNSLKPKFDQYGVEIIRVANIDRSPNVDIGDADVVIAMVELMSSGQRAKVKELARRHNRRFIGLSRQGSDWAREFASAEAALEKAAAAPPPSVRVPVLPKSWTPVVVAAPVKEEPVEEPASPETEVDPSELKDMLNMFEQENEKLEEETVLLKRKITELDAMVQYYKEGSVDTRMKVDLDRAKLERDQQAAEVRVLKKKLEDLEKSTVSKDSYEKLSGQYVTVAKELDTVRAAGPGELARLRRELSDQAVYVKNAKREVEAFNVSITNLNKQIEEIEALRDRQAEELFRLRQENEALRKGPPASQRATVKATEDFLKVRAAFATLWRSGVMNDKEILDKLMNWQPKEGT